MRRHCSERSTSREGAVQNGHAVAEAGEELARHGRREGDFGHQQQRAAAFGQHRFDGVEVDFGLARAGDAVQQKSWNWCAWMAAPICSKAACWAGFSACRARTRRGGDRRHLGLQRDQPLARQRPRRRRWRLCTVPSRSFRLCDPGAVPGTPAARARACSAWHRPRRRGGFSSTRSRSEGARSGSRSVCTCSATMKPLRSSDLHGLIGQRQRFRQVRRRERPLFQHAQDLRHRDRRAPNRAAVGARRRGRHRSATRPCRCRISEASGSMPRSTSPRGAQ